MLKPVQTALFEPRAATAPGPLPVARTVLLAFEHDGARVVELPRDGTLAIGSAAECGLRLDPTTAAPVHARVSLEGGRVWVRAAGDGPATATFVNGLRVDDPRELWPGDVLGIGEATIVLHSSQRPAPRRTFVGFEELRRRLEEELERGLRYERPVSVLALGTGLPRPDREAVTAALSGKLRFLDAACWSAPGEILVLLPETDAAHAPAACRRILALLSDVAPRATAGFASHPADGCEPETILAAARAASSVHAAGPAGPATPGARRLDVAGREALVADPAMARLYGLVERLAASDVTVLVWGETGTGKELVAGALHAWSPRRAGPFVTINCAAIPDSLVESELFGHERGAFSGADAAKPGLLETAHGGTVLLDEVGELPLAAQAKLLRALDDRRVTRVGGVQSRRIDVRVVAATNRDLGEELRAGRFRQDLYYRLSGSVLFVPPLRDRPREIPILARALLDAACRREGRAVPPSLADGAMRILAAYSWPGNVRELENLAAHLAAAVPGPRIEAADLTERLGVSAPASPKTPPDLPAPAGEAFRPLEEEIRELERARMGAALERAGGNQTRAAALIAMPIRTWYAKAKQYGLGARDGRGAR